MKAKKTKAAPKMRHETDSSGYVLGATVGKGKLPRGTKAARVPLKKINAVAALRRELAAVKARELSERLEKETAQRLLRERDAEVVEARKKLAITEASIEGYLRMQGIQERVALVREDSFQRAARSTCYGWNAEVRSARGAMALALGTVELERAEAAHHSDRAEAAESRAARLDQMRIAVAAWARDYFRPDDPALAWALSMLDPVEECGGVVAMGSGSSIAVAAEGKSA